MSASQRTAIADQHVVIGLDFDNCFGNSLVRYMLLAFCIDYGPAILYASNGTAALPSNEINQQLASISRRDWSKALDIIVKPLMQKAVDFIEATPSVFEYFKALLNDERKQKRFPILLPLDFTIQDVRKKLTSGEQGLLIVAINNFYIPHIEKTVPHVIDEFFWLGNQKLTAWIASLHQKFSRCSIICDSLRQNRQLNNLNEVLNGIGSAFPRIKNYTERLAREFAQYDHLKDFLPQYLSCLLPDLYFNLAPGSTFQLISENKNSEAQHLLAKYKQDMSYAFSHFLMGVAPLKEKMTFYIVDDSPEVHVENYKFYANAEKLLPSRFTLGFMPYSNAEFMYPLDENTLEIDASKNRWLSNIVGQGVVDKNLSVSLRELASLCVSLPSQSMYDASGLHKDLKQLFLLNRFSMPRRGVDTLFANDNEELDRSADILMSFKNS